MSTWPPNSGFLLCLNIGQDCLNVQSVRLALELATRTSLKNHFNFVHKKTGGHICSACDKSYSTKGEVKKHFATIHEQIKYDCDICSKSFASKQGLRGRRGHVETAHEGKKQSAANFSRQNKY